MLFRSSEQQYKGTVSVKFGPASMSFRGEIEVKSIDASSLTLVLVGKGTDSTGSSGASMDLTARIEALDAQHCNLLGNSTVSVSGKAATFGGRMMGSVADQVLKQFAANFGARVEQLQASQSAGGGSTQSADAAPAATPGSSTNAPALAPEPTQLNALALLWGVLRDWFKSLFGTSRG